MVDNLMIYYVSVNFLQLKFNIDLQLHFLTF